MAVDILIIRNKADAATIATNAIGDGLKDHLVAKGMSVTDLSDAQASPANVVHWLNSTDNRTKKLIVGLDHGSCSAFYGEKDGGVAAVVTKANCEDLTKNLHVYTFACSTAGDNCVGPEAISKGCYSWLGYVVPVYVFTNTGSGLFQTLKGVIWSYVTALAEGKTLEQAEAILRAAYQANVSKHSIFSFNESKLKLHKAGNNYTINSHNRVVIMRNGVKSDGFFAYGPQRGNVWAHFVDLGWKALWPEHDAQVIAMLAHLVKANQHDRAVSFLEDDNRVKTLYD